MINPHLTCIPHLACNHLLVWMIHPLYLKLKTSINKYNRRHTLFNPPRAIRVPNHKASISWTLHRSTHKSMIMVVTWRRETIQIQETKTGSMKSTHLKLRTSMRDKLWTECIVSRYRADTTIISNNKLSTNSCLRRFHRNQHRFQHLRLLVRLPMDSNQTHLIP